MARAKKNIDGDIDIEIGLDENQKWSADKLARIKAFAKNKAKKRSPQRQLLNELLSIIFAE
jgi:hypothetical protein